jgi:hypothetical protein
VILFGWFSFGLERKRAQITETGVESRAIIERFDVVDESDDEPGSFSTTAPTDSWKARGGLDAATREIRSLGYAFDHDPQFAYGYRPQLFHLPHGLLEVFTSVNLFKHRS